MTAYLCTKLWLFLWILLIHTETINCAGEPCFYHSDCDPNAPTLEVCFYDITIKSGSCVITCLANSECKENEVCAERSDFITDPSDPNYFAITMCISADICTMDDECIYNPLKNVCDKTTFRCVIPECKIDLDCNNSNKRCNLITYKCEDKPPCKSQFECAQPTPICNLKLGVCVDDILCFHQNDCQEPIPNCNKVMGKCTDQETCLEFSDCDESTSICNIGEGLCIPLKCSVNSDCLDQTYYCDLESGTCTKIIQCSLNDDCVANYEYCNEITRRCEKHPSTCYDVSQTCQDNKYLCPSSVYRVILSIQCKFTCNYCYTHFPTISLISSTNEILPQVDILTNGNCYQLASSGFCFNPAYINIMKKCKRSCSGALNVGVPPKRRIISNYCMLFIPLLNQI